MGKRPPRADRQTEIDPCGDNESQGKLHGCQPCQDKFQAVVPLRCDQKSYGQDTRDGQIRRKLADTAGACRTMKSSRTMVVPKPRLIRTAIKSTAAMMTGFCLVTFPVLAGDHPAPVKSAASGPEAILVKSLQEIAESRMDSALTGIDELLKTNPNFRLAHLIKGDLLLARARPITDLGNNAEVPQEHVADLRAEARVRVQRHQEPVPRNLIPRYLLQMPPEQKYAIIADTGKSRLYVFRNAGGMPQYVADYYISSGK